MSKLYVIYRTDTHDPIAIVDDKDLADFITASYPAPCSIYSDETEVSLKELDDHYLWR